MDQKLSHPKPFEKTMHKTIGRFAQPNIGSKKNSPQRCPRPRKGGYLPPQTPYDPPTVQSAQQMGGLCPPSNPQLTM